MQKTVSRSETEIIYQQDTELSADDAYQSAFQSWRQQTDHPFVLSDHPTKTPVTFLEGVGMQEEDPSMLLRRKLRRISNYMGSIFLSELVAPYLVSLVCIFAFSFCRLDVSYSIHDSILYGDDLPVLTTMILQELARYCVPLLIMRFWIRMPRQVTYCHQKTPVDGWLRTLAVTGCTFSTFSCFFMALPKTTGYDFALGRLHASLFGLSPTYQTIYFLFMMLCHPLLETILYNGTMLHTLRQFGDDTAVLLTALFAALMTQNLLTAGAIFTLSVLCSRMVLRYHNIFAALISRYIFYFLSFLNFYFFVFRGSVSSFLQNAVVLSIGLISMLICILLTWKAPISKSRMMTNSKVWKSTFQFVSQANLLTLAMGIALILSIIAVVL